MKILIYGAGVIGSLYAVLFGNAGLDVTVYARGKRLQELTEGGLLYSDRGEVRSAHANIIGVLDDQDIYDFILLAVREHQLHAALEELKNNQSRTIVTMVNSLEAYSSWEKICGRGRILPASLVSTGLKITYRSGFGDRFMYQHSIKAPDEMKQLHDQFYQYLRENKGRVSNRSGST